MNRFIASTSRSKLTQATASKQNGGDIHDPMAALGSPPVARGFLHIRVDEETKVLIERAARQEGKSLTTFVLDAAKYAAMRVHLTRRLPASHRGVPKHFETFCLEAKRGGARGYFNAGYALATCLDAEIPWGLSDEEWQVEVGRLKEHIAKGNDEAAVDWFVGRYPKSMKLVPRRRWTRFVAGVRAAYEQGRIK
jgi:hypothetical protein